ncbi:hypothetical protein [Methylorubrum rhodesianum]|uniref:hypothetical protein n=1 Tax=Methylorubrum rhodesianum TaxID=29427 RepID=UPI003748E562
MKLPQGAVIPSSVDNALLKSAVEHRHATLEPLLRAIGFVDLRPEAFEGRGCGELAPR